MRNLLIDPVKEVRASAYRVVRHLVTDVKTIELLIKMHFPVLIARSLVRDQRMEHEREQSLKLVRSFLTVPGGAKLIPRTAVSALVAIAETAEDKMNSIAVETLMEISLQNLELVAHTGGLKPVPISFLSFFPLLDSLRSLVNCSNRFWPCFKLLPQTRPTPL